MDENPYRAPQENPRERKRAHKPVPWIGIAAVVATICTLVGAYQLLIVWAFSSMVDRNLTSAERTAEILSRLFADPLPLAMIVALMVVPWIVFAILVRYRPTHS
jgi:H+/Cl- antiporter ClcA